MWPTSPAFSTALLQNSRRWAGRIEILYGDQVVAVDTVMITGYILLDNVAVRRSLYITWTDADGVLTPATARDLLSPKGTEIRVYRGLYLADGSIEYIPLGVFGLITVEIRANSDGTLVQIKGFDRVDAVRKREFLTPWSVAGGTLVTTAIAAIVTSRITVPVKITPSALTTPEIAFDHFSSPWDAVRSLAASAGMVAYFDQLGSLVIGPNVSQATGVVYTIGTEVATLMNIARDMDSSETYSGIIVHGLHPDTNPIEVSWWDTDVNSPTYYLGPFGARPYTYGTELINTVPQAQAVLDALRPIVTGIKQEVEIYTVGTIAHDVGDSFQVIDPRTKTTGFYTVISATIPLITTQQDMVRLRCMETVT